MNERKPSTKVAAVLSGWRETEPTVYEREGDHSREDTDKWNNRPDELLKLAIRSVRTSGGASDSK